MTPSGAGTLPSGDVTFVFTDVEGSTRLLRELGAEAWSQLLAGHRSIVRDVVADGGGVEVDTQGDAFFLAFGDAQAAVRSAEAIRLALAPGLVRLRIGIHAGRPLVGPEGYVGEDVHLAARIAAAAHGGQIVLSEPTRALLPDTVVTEALGEHRLKDFPTPIAIHQLGGGRFPPLRSLGATNLPTPLTTFLGRQADVAEARARLERSRLVTLTGPGGTGKTRIAIEVARSVAGTFPAGVWWVSCAPLREPALVLDAIGEVLGARDDLATAIGSRRMLLVIDNLEQVVSVGSALAGLCVACPELRILATSRERLAVAGEDEQPVPTLPADDAVSLFCARSGLEPDTVIETLCRRLDDLPLAVELAAARSRAVAPRLILDRLDRRLDLLAGGRDVDGRRETLRATIDWSHDLLSADDRAAFRRLAAFADGCSFEAAESVVGDDVDVLAALDSLLGKSLIRTSHDRFWMLETIRAYAAEQLATAPEREAVEERFVAWVVGLVEDADRDVRGPRQVGALARLDDELENIRAAIQLAITSGRVDSARQIVHATAWWMSRRGRTPELAGWADASLALAGGDPRIRGRVLLTAAFVSDDRERLETLGTEGLAIARAAGDEALEASFLERLAFIRPAAEAMAMLEAAEATFARIGRPDEANRAAINRGALALEHGAFAAAEPALTSALARVEPTGNRHGIGVTLANRAMARLALGRVDAAEADLGRAIEELDAVGDIEGLTSLLGLAGLLVARHGDVDLGATLLASADASRQRLGLAEDTSERRVRDELIGLVETLDPARREAARSSGRELDVTQAIEAWRDATAGR